MNFVENVWKVVAPLKQRVSNMVARAVLRVADDAKKIQIVQVDLLDGETRDDIERFQNYGFTSVPREGAEAAVIFVGGRRDHGLCIAVDDRRYRLKDLEAGEVAIYNDAGARVLLKASGEIELTPKPGQIISLASNVEISGNLNASGTITGTTDVVGGGKSLKTHTHGVVGANGSGPVVFVPAATTAGPV